MAGSMANFHYYTDAGTVYVMRMDESNARAVGNEEMNTALSYAGVPRNITKRYVVYRSPDQRTRRKIYVSKKDTSVPAEITVKAGTGEDITLAQPQVIPEKIRVYFKADSGLNDGTP